MSKLKPKEEVNPPQEQPRPGSEEQMKPVPETDPLSKGSGKLQSKRVLITGGDSGIGKAVAKLFASEGADIALCYLNEDEDADQAKAEIEHWGVNCVLIPADISREDSCREVVEIAVESLGGLDILVNNAAAQWEQEDIANISTEQLLKTFSTNFFSCFWMSKYALEHLKEGACIINTTSVTAYRGSPTLMDYAATKGAIVAFTRSLAGSLVKRGIRVNAVAPGPIWTPLIVSSFDAEKVSEFGSDTPMKRPGQPNEVAPSYLFLACDDNSYMTGQVLHPNGGEIINA
ncbi:SDR family oxidoreductase [Niabella sp. W65]|jgi:NAD(P)-dependent dehydrogenase (short-subunit alcohol dehydrogenase family)|nr:SDR family oxidoreductase [Niabella sp. W65]MCH7364178.1 SDR family oxidoreductase [Niabella sp. W65]